MDFIEENFAFSFTGKVNVLMKESGQFLGQIMQDNGSVVNAVYGELRGKNAIGKLMRDAQQKPFQYKVIVEPEIIPPGEILFRMSLDELYAFLKDFFEEEQSTAKLRPPPDMRILVRGDFIVAGNSITSDEFETMLTTVDYARIGDIYKHCSLSEPQVTRALISLRKKGAIKVIAH